MYKQLSLIEETREEVLSREMESLKTQVDKFRKSQFAKIGELKKMYVEQTHELQTLKAAICRGNI